MSFLPAGATATTKAPPLAISMADFLQTKGPEAALILSDLDGCLISGAVVLPDVPKLMARAADRIWLVSNNSSDTSVTMQARLARLGLSIPAERILLAGEIALRRIAALHCGAEIALYASAPLQDLARALGLKPNRGEKDCRLALLARDPDFSLTDLERLMRLAHHGCEIWLSNPDLIHPAADGTPVPETGALLAALRAGLPDVEIRHCGKPSATMIHMALQSCEIAPQDAVFIGDTDATDGAAARQAGVPFVLLCRPNAAQTGAKL